MNSPTPAKQVCRGCGNLFDHTADHFPRDRSKPSGLASRCRECNRSACRQKRHKNLAESREEDRRRYHFDPKRRESVKRAAQTRYREHDVELRAAARARQEEKRVPPVEDSAAGSGQANGTDTAASEPRK